MRRIAWIAIIIAFVCGGLYSFARAATYPDPPAMSNYCATPPFLTQSAAPNILLVIDISGSMQYPVYIPKLSYSVIDRVYQVGVPDDGSANYVGTKEYYGYFNTSKFYQYSSSKFVERTDGDCTDEQWNTPTDWSSDKIPGNLLNWATMTRIDILRKVLIGGKSSSSYTSSTQTLVSEGGTWTYTDTNLNCTFHVSGGTTQSHTIYISGSGCPVTLGTSSSRANVQLDIPQQNRVGVIQEMADGNQDGVWDDHAPRFGSET